MDDTWIDCRERCVVHSQPLEHARAKGIDHHVGYHHEIVEQLPPGIRLEVDDDALLVAIEREKQRAYAAIRRHRRNAAEVALGGFDLDDFRPEVRKHLRAVSAGDNLAELQYAHAFEGI